MIFTWNDTQWGIGTSLTKGVTSANPTNTRLTDQVSGFGAVSKVSVG